MWRHPPLALLAIVLASSAGSCEDVSVDCDALSRQAGVALDDVIQASQGRCTQDSDCVVVGHASACHDYCSRVVVASSLETLAAARAAIDAGQCEEFASGGCALVRPPCVPPLPVACRGGVCTEAGE